MNVFKIVFDRPEGYYPGQTVTGQAIINACTPIKTRYLKICFHGGAHTEWSTYDHEYCSEIEYISGEAIAWVSKDRSGILPKGLHTFPFSFPLPLMCPASFEGEYGDISYHVRVELDKPIPWKTNKVKKPYFKVLSNIDISLIPNGSRPLVEYDSREVGVFKKGVVSMKATIKKTAWTHGKFLPISVNIDNNSNRPVTCLRAELLQLSRYQAKQKSSSSTREHHEKSGKVVSMSRENLQVAAGTKSNVNFKIMIPKFALSFECPIISVKYRLAVILDIDSTSNKTLTCHFNIVIGNAPAVAPSAPPAIERTLSSPPPYPSDNEVVPTHIAGPSAPPPSYEESMSTAKV